MLKIACEKCFHIDNRFYVVATSIDTNSDINSNHSDRKLFAIINRDFNVLYTYANSVCNINSMEVVFYYIDSYIDITVKCDGNTIVTRTVFNRHTTIKCIISNCRNCIYRSYGSVSEIPMRDILKAFGYEKYLLLCKLLIKDIREEIIWFVIRVIWTDRDNYELVKI